MFTCAHSANCPLATNRSVDMEGDLESQGRPLFIGDILSRIDEEKGKPFQGKSREILDKVLSKYYKDIEYNLSNVVWCRPKGNKIPSKKQIDYCGNRNLSSLILKLKPSYLVAVGKTALAFLTGHGNFDQYVGRVIWSFKFNLPVFVVYHPSELLTHYKTNKKLKTLFDISYRNLGYYRKHGHLKTKKDWKIVESLDDLRLYLEDYKKGCLLSIDWETTGLDYDCDLLGMGLYTPNHKIKGLYIPVNKWDSYSDTIKPYWTNEEEKIVQGYVESILINSGRVTAYNAKYDILQTAKFLSSSAFIYKVQWDDPSLMKHIIKVTNDLNKLEEFLKFYPDLMGYDLERIKETVGKNYKKVSVPVTGNYCIGDNELNFNVTKQFYVKLNVRQKKTYKDIFSRAIPIYAEAQYRGVRVDTDYLRSMEKLLDEKYNETNDIFKQTYLMNPNSADQVAEYLFEIKKLRPIKHGKKRPSVDKTVLEKLKTIHYKKEDIVKFLDMIIRLRNVSHIQSTYTKGLWKLLDKNSRLHPEALLKGTETGRRAYRKPNHNFPNRDPEFRVVRGSLVPELGHWWDETDLSQAELRWIAFLSGDKNMLKAFRSGISIHAITAMALGGILKDDFDKSKPEHKKLYNFSKEWNFGTFYGGVTKNLVSGVNSKLPKEEHITLEYGESITKKQKRLYATAFAYRDKEVRLAERKGYVDLPYGHRRYGNDANALFNTKVQGSSGYFELASIVHSYDVLKEKKLEKDIKFIFDIHDSSTWDFHPDLLDEKRKATEEGIQRAGEDIGLDFMESEHTLYKERWGFGE